MYNFKVDSVITCSRCYVVNEHCNASIHFAFKELTSGKWLMHMHADYVCSFDGEVTDPYAAMSEWTTTWMRDLRNKFNG
jgi:hypothetical protein